MTSRTAWQRLAARLAALGAALAIAALFYSIVPPFQSPDEFDHIKRAYGLRSGQIVVTTPPGQSSGLWVDDGLLAMMKAYDALPLRPASRVDATMVANGEAARWTGTRSFSAAPGAGYYFPLAYVPQAVALTLGESLGWTVANSYRLARLTVLLASLAVLLLAFGLFPTNFFTLNLLLLPMTLFQFSSASLDPLTTALAILCAALFLRGANRASSFPPWMAAALGGAIVILATCRLHMIAVTLLPFVLYRVRGERIHLLLGLGSIVVAAAWTLAALLTTHDLRTGGVEQRVLPIALYYLGHPARFVEVIWATVTEPAVVGLLGRQFVGILGWLDTLLPGWAYLVAAAVLVVTLSLSVSKSTLKEDAIARGALLAVAFSAVFLIFALLLVGGTRHPAVIVLGIQGRYFVLPLILAGYALQGNAALLQTPRRYLGYPVLALWGALAVYVSASSLLQRYYAP